MDDEDSLEWTEGLLDGIVEKVEREQAEAVARLRAQGIEPASRENQVYAGLPLVSFTLLPLDGTGIEVRLRFDDDAGETVLAWGKEWPLHGAPVDAAVLLDALAEHWPLVAGWTHVPRLVDSDGTLSVPGLPPLRIEHEPDDLVVSCERGTRRFGSERVLFTCTMMALGDTLARYLGPGAPACAAWRTVREATDLPPSDIEGEGPLALDTFVEQTKWLAGRLGVDVEAYRLAAVDVHARQILAAMGDGTESPAREEWDPRHVPEGLDVADVCHKAGLAVERLLSADPAMTPERFHEEAVVLRNSDAWQQVFYPRETHEPEAPTP